jgi:two-component system, NarL family, response regulator LiaR
MEAAKRPVRLAIVNDYAVVVAGVAALLAPERVDIVETDASQPVITDVDIVLYDTFALVQGDRIDLADLVRDAGARVVVYSWSVDLQLVREALATGASGYFSKGLTGAEIVEGLERVMGGEVVVLTDHGTSGEEGDWPGRSAGLTPREAEIMALITQGLSNQEIAAQAYLSINTVKSYIRAAYRKIDVTSRSQAVLWGIENGFSPDTARAVDPALLQRPAARVHTVPQA